MTKPQTLYARLELIWWLITAIVAAVVLFPIIRKLPDFPFLWSNVAFVVAFITLTRYIFLLRYTFLADRMLLKVTLFFLCIPIAFLLVQEINAFQVYLDENGPDSLVTSLPSAEQNGMMTYIRSEMLLFGVGSVISSIILPIRLLVSIWRRYNGYSTY